MSNFWAEYSIAKYKTKIIKMIKDGNNIFTNTMNCNCAKEGKDIDHRDQYFLHEKKEGKINTMDMRIEIKNLNNHHYLSDKNCVDRLLEEYKKHGCLVVSYDLDNTVKDYHKKGHDYSEVIELIRECRKAGFYLIVFTAEEDTEKVKDFLFINCIPYDAINENPPFWDKKGRKIYYNILLDDRAGLYSSYNQLKKVLRVINNTY